MTAAVIVKALRKSFGATEVLRGIDLEVAAGDVTCIIGPSGSGKSTLLRCIAFLDQATDGYVFVQGEPLGFAPDASGARARLPDARVRDVRAKIGMVFQQFNLWPHRTALGNVTEALTTVRGIAPAEARERGLAQLRKVGLEAHADHFPAQLSGGQQQRVAIARALALEPQIMLFDEPTSSLDPELTGEVLNVMRALASEGMTMVVVTHEMGFARRASHRVVFMSDGAIVEDAEPEEFFSNPKSDRAKDFLGKILNH